MGRKWLALLVGFYIFIFVLSLALSYSIFTYKKIHTENKANPLPEQRLFPTPTPIPGGPKSILLIGYGGEGHSGGLLSDSIILAQINEKEKKVNLISIPRDLWVELPDEETGNHHYKVNWAFAKGGGDLAKKTISKITNLPVDYFIAANFGGFKHVIDILGGVEVDVPFEFSDEFYPIAGRENDSCGKTGEEIAQLTKTLSGYKLEQQFKCRYETVHFDKGKTLMKPDTALKFVRSRHSEVNGGDFGRMIRQHAVLKGIKNKILSFETVPRIIPLVNKIAEYVQTDLDISSLIELAKTYEQIPNVSLNSIYLTTEDVLIESRSSDGQFILLPKDGVDKWEGIHKYIQENLK